MTSQARTGTTRHNHSRTAPVALACAIAVGLVACGSAGGQPPTAEGTAAEQVAADGVVDAADGVLPDGGSPLDQEHPGIANLDPALLAAMQQAAADARDDDIEILVNSGWRSPEYQDELLTEAVAEYGSAEEAARWVATADTSSHVSGDAVDITPYDAIDWLARFGARYGLCQIYGNEVWHFELRPEAIDGGCPPLYADPTEDPRLTT